MLVISPSLLTSFQRSQVVCGKPHPAPRGALWRQDGARPPGNAGQPTLLRCYLSHLGDPTPGKHLPKRHSLMCAETRPHVWKPNVHESRELPSRHRGFTACHHAASAPGTEPRTRREPQRATTGFPSPPSCPSPTNPRSRSKHSTNASGQTVTTGRAASASAALSVVDWGDRWLTREERLPRAGAALRPLSSPPRFPF